MNLGATALAKQKHRTPSGRPSRAGEPKEHAPALVQRLREAALRGMADPEWGTELGRLFLQQAITAPMYAAGKRWAEMASKYQRTIGVFPSRSVSLERGIRSAQPDPDSEEGRKIAKREANAAERFFEAHAVLVQHGALAEAVVRRLCEHNEMPIGVGELMKLRTGLDALAFHWALTSGANSNSGR